MSDPIVSAISTAIRPASSSRTSWLSASSVEAASLLPHPAPHHGNFLLELELKSGGIDLCLGYESFRRARQDYRRPAHRRHVTAKHNTRLPLRFSLLISS